MSFGRDLDPSRTQLPRHFLELWTFSAVRGWRRLDYDALCGCFNATWAPPTRGSRLGHVSTSCGTGAWRLRCPQARWGHAMVIPPPLATDEPAVVLFVGGWGSDGRAIHTVLKLHLVPPARFELAISCSRARSLLTRRL